MRPLVSQQLPWKVAMFNRYINLLYGHGSFSTGLSQCQLTREIKRVAVESGTTISIAYDQAAAELVCLKRALNL